jgi:hypothetical protein
MLNSLEVPSLFFISFNVLDCKYALDYVLFSVAAVKDRLELLIIMLLISLGLICKDDITFFLRPHQCILYIHTKYTACGVNLPALKANCSSGSVVPGVT